MDLYCVGFNSVSSKCEGSLYCH